VQFRFDESILHAVDLSMDLIVSLGFAAESILVIVFVKPDVQLIEQYTSRGTPSLANLSLSARSAVERKTQVSRRMVLHHAHMHRTKDTQLIT